MEIRAENAAVSHVTLFKLNSLKRIPLSISAIELIDLWANKIHIEAISNAKKNRKEEKAMNCCCWLHFQHFLVYAPSSLFISSTLFIFISGGEKFFFFFQLSCFHLASKFTQHTETLSFFSLSLLLCTCLNVSITANIRLNEYSNANPHLISNASIAKYNRKKYSR